MIDSNHEEIHEIIRTSSNVREFYAGFLSAVSKRSNAQIGVAWNCTESPYSPICQIQTSPESIARLPISEQRHANLLRKAAESDRAIMVRAQGEHVSTVDRQLPAPTILFGPIRRDARTELVEFILPPDNSEELNRQVLEFLISSCKLAEAFEDDNPTSGQTIQLSSSTINLYAHLVHSNLDYKQTAATVANETRRILDVDRVSVALRKGPTFKLFAISGQPSVNCRSNLVTSLEGLVNTVLKTGKSFWYPTQQAFPPQIESHINDYLSHSSTRSLAIIPVFDEPEQAEDDAPLETNRVSHVIGGVVIEQCSQEWDRGSVEPAIEIATRHACQAIRNVNELRRIPFYPVWRAVGKMRVLTTTRNLPKTVSAAFVLLTLTLLGIFVPASFNLSCDGVLVPAQRRRIFAEADGQLEIIHVAYGTEVLRGAPLFQLSSNDLEIQIEQTNSEIAALRERLSGDHSSRIQNSEEQDEGSASKINDAIGQQLERLEKINRMLVVKQQKLQVNSPIDGQVMTWNIQNKLPDRPVKQGELLIEVANVNGQWQLELEVADRRVGHLLEAERTSDQPIEVVYQLATEPARRFTGQVKKIARTTSVTADNRQVVRVTVEIDEADIMGRMQVGAEVAAKIRCGTRSLGYVWLHDAVEFVNSKIIFRIW